MRQRPAGTSADLDSTRAERAPVTGAGPRGQESMATLKGPTWLSNTRAPEEHLARGEGGGDSGRQCPGPGVLAGQGTGRVRVICSPGSQRAWRPPGHRTRSRPSRSSCRHTGAPAPPRCSCSTCPGTFHQFQGHSPEGCRILSLLVSTEGHRDYLGSCHLPDTALPGPGSHPGSSWSMCSIPC